MDPACFQRLKLKYDEPVSNFAFNRNLRPSMMGTILARSVAERITDLGLWTHEVNAGHQPPTDFGVGLPCDGVAASSWRVPAETGPYTPRVIDPTPHGK